MKISYNFFIKSILIIAYMSIGIAHAEIDCNSLNALQTTETECAKCPNRSFGIAVNSVMWHHEEQLVCYLTECPEGYFFDSRLKNCLPCDYDQGGKCLNVSAEECAKCPNRELNKYHYTTQCELPFKCPKDKPILKTWGGFEDSCGRYCESCDKAEDSFQAEDCSVCSGYVKNKDGLCVKERNTLAWITERGKFRTKDWILKSCDDTDGYKASEAECQRCSNRIYKDGICMLESCPSDNIRSLDGRCIKKKYAKYWDYFRSTEDECKKLENHQWYNDFCVLKKDNYFFSEDRQELYPCDTLGSYATDPFWCQGCSNRMVKEDPIGRGYMCALKECPSDNPLRSLDYDCYNCNSPQTVYATQEQCLKCSNRKWNNNLCSRTGLCTKGNMLADIYSKKDPKVNEMWESGGVGGSPIKYECVSCLDKMIYKTTEEQCAKCPNRIMKDGYCYRNF